MAHHGKKALSSEFTPKKNGCQFSTTSASEVCSCSCNFARTFRSFFFWATFWATRRFFAVYRKIGKPSGSMGRTAYLPNMKTININHPWIGKYTVRPMDPMKKRLQNPGIRSLGLVYILSTNLQIGET